ncbi:hypothetical protein CASFOL_040118 [Castilleja foliolosa]|uniref:Helicase-like transcription factor CHR28 n=1 Tax=Castilleja foliolosa TaxID=1961234 RepID=A0ABD3BEY0_9LAMI
MAASVDPIDISSSDGGGGSSDSDSEFRAIDNYRDEESPVKDTASSTTRPTPRILPDWALSNHSNLTGRQGPSSSKKQIVVHDDFSSRPHKRLNIAESVGASSSRIGDSVFRKTGSNIIHSSSHQPTKRSLPAYLDASTSNVRSSNLVETIGASEVRDAYGKPSYQSAAWSNFSNGNNSMNDFMSLEKKGNRLLPSSLMPGKHTLPATFVVPNDPFHHNGVGGEESPAGADERFVFQAAVQDLHQPKVQANLPEGLLTVSLLRHQKIALAWMLSKESSGLCLGGILADDQGLGKTISTIALIQMQKVRESKSKDSSNNTKTEALNLDDDDNGFVSLVDASNTTKGFQSRRPTAGTLIVCPASVLRQWDRELDEKVTREAKLSVLIYHGGNRTKDPAALAKYDAVLTTYAIVTNEVPKQPLVDEDDDEQRDGDRYGLSSAFSMDKKRKKVSANKKSKKGKKEIDMSVFDSDSGTLARVKWSRVVLDESQTIKNHRTQVARACCSLRAKRRWCLSGTPIQNSVDELYSYFRFLRYDPYDKFKTFGSSIKAPILRDSTNGYRKLQVVLRNIMLRRTKGTFIDGEPIINLPPKKVELARVEFSVEERTFYDKLASDSLKQFKAYAAAGTVNQNYANILLMLLRLRQACDHPLLVKGLTSDPVGKVSSQMAQMLPRELLVNLLKQLETSLAICLVCRDPPENAVVTMCGHVFCYQCVSDYLTGEDNTCPTPECKEQLGADVVFSRLTLKRCISDDTDGNNPFSNGLDDNSIVLQSNYISSKIKSALEILKTHCISRNRNPDLYKVGDASSSADGRYEGSEKAIVFSQWTSMLDLVESSLKKSFISYRRLDGTMSIAARDKAVKDFNNDPEVDVMIMSLKAGNLGLNMVAASRVIMLDLWWNPTTEDQAVDRAHRIGQTRPVTVSRLTIKDTVEDRILSLQDDKRKIVASAFGEDQSSGHGTKLTADDIRFLFEGR